MDIVLTISYSLNIPRDEFFDPQSRCVTEKMRERLEAVFPQELTLTADTTAKREHLYHFPLYEGKNSLKCASCGKWLYMPGKEEYMLACLECCKMVKDIPLCPGCAWELEKDLDDEKFVQELRKKYKSGLAE